MSYHEYKRFFKTNMRSHLKKKKLPSVNNLCSFTSSKYVSRYILLQTEISFNGIFQ